MPDYCDVSLPVPLDQSFTYALPETMRHRVRAGCRVLVPFGARKLTGVVLRAHDDPPGSPAREALRLLDEEPALDEALLKLGCWIASYYCAPLGETLRAMTPLSGELRQGKIYSLTPAGRDAARQLFFGGGEQDAASRILRMLDARQLSANYLAKKIENGARVLKSLEKRGFVESEDTAAQRDPLRAPAVRLRVEFKSRADKLPKPERELLAFLELHPGTHNLAEVEKAIAKAGRSARSLARRGLVSLALAPAGAPETAARGPHSLNEHQRAALDAIHAALERKQFQTFLLQGVTGSGKTEIYLRAIEEALASGRGALMLVPEIGLTPAVAGQFQQRFGQRVAILHSAFHDSERAREWRRIRGGEAGVVVATRSGVFAPVRNLGLIVVDEEHDQSYKQQETPRYHGRDVAIVRARDAGAVAVLGSATPSLESRYNAESGKYALLALPQRVESRPMPEVTLIDMRREFQETRKFSTFSRALIEAVNQRLENGEQSMLLLNRRGFSSFAVCRSCGERVQCANCSVALTYHKRDRRMLCHYCNYSAPVPERCPRCDSDYVQFQGTGSERVEEELHAAFPRARIARLDRDTVGRKRDYETILAAFRGGDYDILVGTQMIAKGHDIANVTLAGIVNADIGLGLPDFRAAERTFQLLTQAAGRAGRGQTPGIVLIQTINPEHYAIQCAASQNYEAFYKKEIEFRRAMSYPPFGALANVFVRAPSEEEAMSRSAALARSIQPAPEGVRVLGPAAAAVARLKNEYRYQMLVKSNSRKRLNEILRQLRAFALKEKWSATALVIDVDPGTMM
ncbi:MAG TPA: primosomal protein N' [Bryobacteraceae bacterium]|jgi:primosomal protein N' (replication factor Y)|nr:primosomal protein N' [Bryobacteraceae bacterium]